MTGTSSTIKAEDLPLFLDHDEVFRIYLSCLNFIGNNIFEMVPEQNKTAVGVSALQLIMDGISPILSCTSRYGACLNPSTALSKKRKLLKIWRLSSSVINLKKINDRLKIIKNSGTEGFSLVPRSNMHLFQYKMLIDEFSRVFCQEVYVHTS